MWRPIKEKTQNSVSFRFTAGLLMLLRRSKLLLSPSSRAAGHLVCRYFDVIVVGGGHAGTEAAAAAARVGAETLLITQKIKTIGVLSCNPSLGGVGKGHLVREVDALDGLCGRAGDWAGIHFSILNRSKGPAVWGPRAQLDRDRYREFIQSELLSTPRLTVLEGAVEGLLVSEPNPDQPGQIKVTGVRIAGGAQPINAKSVILTTGTFLSGALFMGQTVSQGGRMGDPPSCSGLSHTLRETLGLKIGRLRTGTPPRIVKDTVQLSLTKVCPGDKQPTPFSFLNKETRCKPEEQLPCYLTHTTPGVERVVKEGLHLNAHIQQDTKGPRYCPSIESRVLRFPGREQQVWLEPEGVASDLLYPQGLSMTLPPELQLRLIREIPALKQAEIRTPGYGVQYDFVCPTQLSPSLQVKKAQGLFLAGQINGTTGYEEAAAQGLWAGVSAARAALSLPLLALSRTQSYIGVLIDDLIVQGVTEPYRMFTSRAEFRIVLRSDNADLRLSTRGFEEMGCVSMQRYKEAVRMTDGLRDAMAALESISMSCTKWMEKLGQIHLSKTKSAKLNGLELLEYKDVTFEMLASAFPGCLSAYLEFSKRLKIEGLYRPHYMMQEQEMERVRKDENLSLPQDVDYLTLPISLSMEAREVLDRAKPHTLGAATRLPGITPSAIVHLLNYVRKTDKEREQERVHI
ncbi:protein MTO1 homolog, mitochondrial isoform X2 [Paramormyrops kingsleyae]|uniref:protein MTO1 homolog, mitochondrial isoform X2 n=1 Tax=Paramormyrops kingsleyae TaxID=1676925 RepID=UPI000CD5E47C|nr:protein MTO1 homolog, mitochondrial isoform X1 [Paramormyrops kingsleyae]